MIQYAATHRRYLRYAEYWMPAFAGMTTALLTQTYSFRKRGNHYPLPLPRMKSKSQPSSACRMVSLNSCA
jgi:hypothetical protein